MVGPRFLEEILAKTPKGSFCVARLSDGKFYEILGVKFSAISLRELGRDFSRIKDAEIQEAVEISVVNYWYVPEGVTL